MAVKEFRRRYILFEVEAPREVERWELIKALQRKASQMGFDQYEEGRPWLTAFNDNRGILRCSHTDKERAIELLGGITEVGENGELKVVVRTLKTSGTIKKVKESMPQTTAESTEPSTDSTESTTDEQIE
jgi:RNase P/RNase MRP subunit POP5